MIWLLYVEALIGMLLLAALLRTRSSAQETPRLCRVACVSRSGIHLVSSRPPGDGGYFAGDGPYLAPSEDGYFLDVGVFSADYRRPARMVLLRQAAARCPVFVMRQFAIRVLGAQWRLRQG